MVLTLLKNRGKHFIQWNIGVEFPPDSITDITLTEGNTTALLPLQTLTRVPLVFALHNCFVVAAMLTM